MVKFNEYSRLSKQIKAPEYLKNQLISGAAGSVRKSYISAGRFKAKVILVAVLLLAFLATACTLAVSSGLIERLARRGLADADTPRSLSTKASESTETDPSRDAGCLAMARGEWAEYRILEAICDYNSIYLHFQIIPLDKSTMLIAQTLNPGSPASELGISGANESTVEEYAGSLGKRLRYAALSLSYDGNAISNLGQSFEAAPDGSLHIYGSCQNPSNEAAFPLTCTVFTYPIGQQTIVPVEERTEFEFTLQNKSCVSSLMFTRFDPEIQEKFGISIESLVIEETELGYYCTFTYRGERAERTLFSMVDENGEYFPIGGPRGSSSNTLNSDGSYSVTCGAPKVDEPEKLMFMLVDENFDKHGPYSFNP